MMLNVLGLICVYQEVASILVMLDVVEYMPNVQHYITRHNVHVLMA